MPIEIFLYLMVHMHTRSFPRLSIFTATSQKKKNPLDKRRKTHPVFPFFSLPLCTGLKSNRMRGCTEAGSTKNSEQSPGMEEECSKALLPGGSMKGGGGAVSKLTWPGALKTVRSRYFKDSSVWGSIAGYRTLDLFGVGAGRKRRGHIFTVSSSDFS